MALKESARQLRNTLGLVDPPRKHQIFGLTESELESLDILEDRLLPILNETSNFREYLSENNLVSEKTLLSLDSYWSRCDLVLLTIRHLRF